jgi:uncharacterized membrane protein
VFVVIWIVVIGSMYTKNAYEDLESKGKVSHVDAMNAQRESGEDAVPLILKPGTRCG